MATERLFEGDGLCGRSTGTCASWPGTGSAGNTLTDVTGTDNPERAVSTDAGLADCGGVIVTDVFAANGGSGIEGAADEASRGAEPTNPGTSPAERGTTGTPAERGTEAASDSR